MKLYDTKAVALFLDLSERRVRQLRSDGIIKEARPGLFDLLETNRSYINYLRSRNPDSETSLDYNTERAKLVQTRRINEEYDLQLKENKLHTSEDVEAVMTAMLVNFRSRLLTIPTKLAPMLSKKTDKTEIASLLQTNINEALQELSDFHTAFDKGTVNRETGDN